MESAREPVSNSQVLGDTNVQQETLEDLLAAPNYRAWLTSLAAPYLGAHPIELGSGLGHYAEDWLAGGLEKITVTEADEGRLQYLRDKFAGDDRVSVRTIDLDHPLEGSYSAFVSFNVLEHIPDDVAALRAARGLVEPGGYVVSFVPAFPALMSDYDRSIGRVRRYKLAEMAQRLEAAGLESVRLQYVNAPGFLAWWLGMRILRRKPTDGAALRIWDSQVIPRTRKIESKRRGVPFGQSVFSVARVPQG